MLRFIFGLLVLVVFNTTPAAANQFASHMCARALPSGWQCVTVAAGWSWQQLVPDANYRLLIQKYNRQNVQLQAGQQLVVPPAHLSWKALSPFPLQHWSTVQNVVEFDPQQLAWAYYRNGSLVHWGPAVGGKNWCPDKNNGRGGRCRTQEGEFFFSEAAGPGRRSSAYPIGCSGTTCAPMPYFTRFTSRGQGLHERRMNGAHASHGCIGLFGDDIRYLNQSVRNLVGRRSYGYFTPTEVVRSQTAILFRVLSY